MRKTRAWFQTLYTIEVESKELIKHYSLFCNNILIEEKEVNDRTIKINANLIDFDCVYHLEINKKELVNVTFEGLYDTEEFASKFHNDEKLGYTYTKEKTIFRVWAPSQRRITIAFYANGTPFLNDFIEEFDMQKKANGNFEITINENMHNSYYTYRIYSIDNKNYTEISDPNATGCGANGVKSLVVNFALLNPYDWIYNDRPNKKRTLNEAIVYELHVRDLTSHYSWNGNEKDRGKYLGLIEEETTFMENEMCVKTGFDHIVELGVTDVQLLPIFDYGEIDEYELSNNPHIFNWGYMPENYNCLEGSYSSDPCDGLRRIKEFKRVVKKFNDNNIGIIMDVVYNHTGKTENSKFEILVPGYYYRKNKDYFYNGSGCGNETASERYMFRKFMLDSIVFWATEYNLSGFRFDLMGLHDIKTMKLIEETLYKIDKSIIVYGEPWQAGGSPLSLKIAANKENLVKMNRVGGFNDISRDAIKGSVFEAAEGGFVQGNCNPKIHEQVKYGIVGGLNHPQLSKNYFLPWHLSAKRNINYVAAHDNNTLWDKISLSTSVPKDQRVKMQMQSNNIVFTSQGLVFLHAGIEFLRSKPMSKGGFDHNSYQSSDNVNQIIWSKKIKYNHVFNHYKNLVKIKKQAYSLNLSDEDILNKLEFIDFKRDDVIAYMIKHTDNLERFIVIHNSINNAEFYLDSEYTMVLDENGFTNKKIQGMLQLQPSSSYILYK